MSGRRGRTTNRRRKGQTFRGAFSGVLLVLAACALAWCGYQTASGHWHATPVLSGSMRPGLQPGDVVITQRVPISDLHVRDVVVFHPPNDAQQQTVHRIVTLSVKDGTTVITTRGDANTIDDPAVTALRGTTAYRVARVVPLVGYPAVWLSGGHHGRLVMGLGVLLLVGAAVTILRPEAPRKELPLDEPEDDSKGTEQAAVPVPEPVPEPMPEDAAHSSRQGLAVLAGNGRPGGDAGSKEQTTHQHTP